MYPRSAFMRRSHIATLIGLSLLAVVGAGVAILLLFDFKGLMERRASAALERPVTIGALHVKVFPLRADLDDLVVADTPANEAASSSAGLPPAGPNRPPLMKAAHVNAAIGF